jgi:DNA polymerase (family 10)
LRARRTSATTDVGAPTRRAIDILNKSFSGFRILIVAQAPSLPNGQAVLQGGGALRVHLTDKARYGSALLFATGSEPHIEGLQALAGAQGFSLTPEGLKRGRKSLAAKAEEDIYAALGLAFIPPELREGRDEIAKAAKGALPRLVPRSAARWPCHLVPP